jgi:periplasmic nitrate reductase NapD
MSPTPLVPSDAQAAQEPELHIAGVLVHVRPEALSELRLAVQTIDGAEVYQASPEGRVVLILEGPNTPALLNTMDHLRALPGVINVSLAYQHAEPLAAMQEEIRP